MAASRTAGRTLPDRWIRPGSAQRADRLRSSKVTHDDGVFGVFAAYEVGYPLRFQRRVASSHCAVVQLEPWAICIIFVRGDPARRRPEQ